MREDKLMHRNYSVNVDAPDYSTNDDAFECIIEKVGSHGRFQMIYNTIFIISLSMAGAMIYMNIILALSIPEHWCTVPGRENTNLSLHEWRELTLPTTTDSRGMPRYSSCHMYDINLTKSFEWRKWDPNLANVTVCRNGWSYDATWFKSTIPTKENWVCSKNTYVANVFVFGRIAEILGSFVLGQMGDIFGRRFVYYISVICCCIGRFLSIITTSNYIWFLIFSGLTSFAINNVFQSPLVIGMEISKQKYRSTIAMYQNFGWSLGITIVSLLFWWLRDWESLMWVSSVPTSLVLLCSHYCIESPRWLISKKRFDDAIKQFKKIAKINGRQFDVTKDELIKMYSMLQEEVTYGIASLFNGWRLARNTCTLGFIRCIVGISYFTIVLFGSSMSGNPFFIFFLQSLAEIPAYFLGKYFGDKYGRRFTNSVSLFVSFLACWPIPLLATHQKYELVAAVLAAFVKLLNALTYFTASLQSMEFYPTCMRQTGIALGIILGNCASILAPYLVYVGTTIDIKIPYYILCALFLIGTVLALFSPETLHKKLPDTMEEARHFGINDKFFSIPKPPTFAKSTSTIQVVDDVVKEKLNQAQYAP